MRLLFVGTNRQPGGAASHFVSLTTAMSRAGHQVAAVASPHGAIWRLLEREPRVTLYPADFKRKFKPREVLAVQRAVRTVRPDWILGSFEMDYWGTALVAAKARIPLALFLHHAELKLSSVHGLPRLVRRFLLPSEHLRQWVVSRGVPPGRTALLYNAVDTDHFCPDPELRMRERAALGIAPDEVLVGYVGRLESNKGVVMLAEALTGAMDRNAKLRALWIGFGKREKEVDRIIRTSPYAARHMRRPWTDDIKSCYAAMDMLVLPSAGPEAFGRVLVEAQACGVPVLGSDIGGIAEAMHVGTTGRLVPPFDVRAWTDQICELAADGAQRTCMGRAGPAFVRASFGNDVIVKALERLIGER